METIGLTTEQFETLKAIAPEFFAKYENKFRTARCVCRTPYVFTALCAVVAELKKILGVS